MADTTPIITSLIDINAQNAIKANQNAGVIKPTPPTVPLGGLSNLLKDTFTSAVPDTVKAVYNTGQNNLNGLQLRGSAPTIQLPQNNPQAAQLPGTVNVTTAGIGNGLIGTGANVSPVPAPAATTPAAAAAASTVPQVKSDKNAAAATGDATQAADEEPKQIPCPGCTGNFLSNFIGRIFASIGSFLSKTFHIRIPTAVVQYFKERLPISKANAFVKGCPVCKGKGTIVDPSDDRAKQKKSAQVAQERSKDIEKQEAKLGTGGHFIHKVQHHRYDQVGVLPPDPAIPAHRVDHDAGFRFKGLAGPGKSDGNVNPKYGLVIPEGARANHVQGLIPPMSPGGVWTMACSNKFQILTGPHGFEVQTNGPVNIQGGITKITGPEISIGSATGALTLEGDVVKIHGKSVEMFPTDGHLFTKGTVSMTGNLMVGGHSHHESASVVRLETTGKNESSKVGAASNIITGPAQFQTKAIKKSINSLLSYVQINTAHPEHLKLMPSLRYINGITDEIINLTYTAIPVELQLCGVALLAGIPLPVFLFPHVHDMPDMMHTHETRIPDIKCDADTAKDLRAAQGGVNGPAPLHKKSTSIIDVIVSIWSSISTIFVASASQTQNEGYKKSLT